MDSRLDRWKSRARKNGIVALRAHEMLNDKNARIYQTYAIKHKLRDV